MRNMFFYLFIAFFFGICAGESFLDQKPAGDVALDAKLQVEEMEFLRKEVNMLKPRVTAGAIVACS